MITDEKLIERLCEFTTSYNVNVNEFNNSRSIGFFLLAYLTIDNISLTNKIVKKLSKRFYMDRKMDINKILYHINELNKAYNQ